MTPEEIQKLRDQMRAQILSGSGEFLPVGSHEIVIEKFYYKKPGPKSPLGLFIAEFKASASTNAAVQIGKTYNELFDPTKPGWETRLMKFLFAALGVDWRGTPTAQEHEAVADIRFAAQFESEREKLTPKYNGDPARCVVDATVRVESSPHKTKNDIEITANQFLPAAS